MALKDCNYCENKVPESGQCNRCGFVDGINRPPTDDEFKKARAINEENKYGQFLNIDMILLD